MARALIQGASRGLGLQFCRHILKSAPSAYVFATCRNPSSADDLHLLRDSYPERLEIVELDVTQEGQIKNAAELVKERSNGSVDLLINCAAMLHPSGKGETSLKDVSGMGLLDTFSTNTIGPLLMAKYFAPLLAKGSGSFGQPSEDQKKKHTGVLVNMSARVGSITDNVLGGWYSYRMSKSALNMATKNLSLELGRGRSKVICVCFHPGTVNTDLSRPYHRNVPKDKLFTTEYSVECLMSIVDKLSMDDTGKYMAWDGQEIAF
ncbi:C-signal-like [Amphiura filiformis]|uniref:C-signal-like n=1 Tax=Amphiura filiformis TaxID=82378 RepID=UPI003B222882